MSHQTNTSSEASPTGDRVLCMRINNRCNICHCTIPDDDNTCPNNHTIDEQYPAPVKVSVVRPSSGRR